VRDDLLALYPLERISRREKKRNGVSSNKEEVESQIRQDEERLSEVPDVNLTGHEDKQRQLRSGTNDQ